MKASQKLSEGNHVSYYDQEWLRKNCYTINNNKKYTSPYKLWDCSLQKNFETIKIDHDEIINSEFSIIQENKNNEVNPRSHG